MSKARDAEIRLPGIKPRNWGLEKRATGRVSYPFQKMLVGDFFVVYSVTEARGVRSALQSFYSRHAGRRFSVRQRADGEWVCRRIA